jgi:hypothetical protein
MAKYSATQGGNEVAPGYDPASSVNRSEPRTLAGSDRAPLPRRGASQVTRVLLLVTGLALVGAVVVIASRQHDSASRPIASPQSPAVVATTTPFVTAPPTTVPASPDAAFTFADSTGDSGTMSETFGPLKTLTATDAPQAVLASCGATNRSLIVRADMTLTVTSDLSATVAVFFNPNAIDFGTTAFLYDYSNGATCTPDLDDVVYTDLNPGARAQFTYWIIYVTAITPDAPSGDPVAIGQALFDLPTFDIATSSATIKSVSGDRVVTCEEAFGLNTQISAAGDVPTQLPSGAVTEGCKPVGG